MARQRTETASPDPRRRLLLVVVLAAVVVVLAFIMLRDEGGPSGAQAATCTPVDTIQHVHGLAATAGPDNVTHVYVATHHGLIRGTNDTDWCRVGPVADYMGFTAHPNEPDTFWVSGHPATGGNMGVRQSTDGGHTWDTIGAEGVDFHAMTVSRADPDRLWGFYQGRIHRSDDGGRQWDIIGQPVASFYALAGHPTEADTLYGAGPNGIQRSADGGQTWQRIEDRAAATIVTHPTRGDTMLAAFQTGVYRSTNGGQDWSRFPLDTSDAVAYLAYLDEDTIYAANGQGGLHKSDDAGATWQRIR